MPVDKPVGGRGQRRVFDTFVGWSPTNSDKIPEGPLIGRSSGLWITWPVLAWSAVHRDAV
jgi:hypothetical protein